MATIIRKATSSFELPPEGSVLGVIDLVKDLGLVMTSFGEKERIRIRWQLSERDTKGKRHTVIMTLNKSLHPNSALGELLGRLGSRPVTS